MPESERIAIQSSGEPWLWISKTLFTRFKLSSRAILAYTTLAYYRYNGTGTVEKLTAKTLGNLVGMGESTMKRALGELVEKGVVEMRRRTKKSRKGNRIPLPNLYVLIDLDKIKADPI